MNTFAPDCELCTFEAATGASGYYVLTQLVLGPFTLTVEARGLNTFRLESVALRVNDHLTTGAQLAAGKIKETVTASDNRRYSSPSRDRSDG